MRGSVAAEKRGLRKEKGTGSNGTQLSGRLYNQMVTRAPTAKIL
jgi:hypothetical protein